MKQGTEEWLAARRGKITCSMMNSVLMMSESYAVKIRQELEGWRPVERRFKAGDWGHHNEDRARATYEMRTGKDVRQVGFIQHPYVDYVGGSPDGLVDTDGVVEIKCPFSQSEHRSNRLLGMPRCHMPQVQGLIWVIDLRWCDFVSFDPRARPPFDFYVERIQRDEVYIAKLAKACERFWEKVNGN